MATVYTDAYGDVTAAQLRAYKKLNVSPSDHEDIAELLGRDNHAAAVDFVQQHGATGAYRAPWPFPRRA